MKTNVYPGFPRYSGVEYTEYTYSSHFHKFGKMSRGIFISDSDSRLPGKPAYGNCRFEPNVPEHLAKFSWGGSDLVFLNEKWDPMNNHYEYKFVTIENNNFKPLTDPEKLAAAERLYTKLEKEKELLNKEE